MVNVTRKILASFATGIMLGFFVTNFLIPRRYSFNDEHYTKVSAGDLKTISNLSNDPVLNTSIRLLCMVITQPKNHEKKASQVKKTWGRRCSILLFMSSEFDQDLPTVELDIDEGRNNLWGKTKLGFQYIYQHYLDKADWFLKADDDTYVIVENMMEMLSPYDPSDLLYFGSRFKMFIKQGYMSGGAGYILSRTAVKRFVEGMVNCRKDNKGAEDVELGRCLEKLNVVAADTRDRLGKWRFFPIRVDGLLMSNQMNASHWFWSYIYYPTQTGEKCCSDKPISFHYISPQLMNLMEYLIYRVQVHRLYRTRNTS